MVRRHIGVRHHVRALQIPPAEEDVRLRPIGQNKNFPVRHTQSIEQRDELLGARLVVTEVVDHDQRIFSRTRIERALARESADLTRDRLHVIASRRTEDRPTTYPVRSAAGTLAGTTGSLLLPRLLVAAGHQTARLRVGEAEALVRQIRLNGLVHHRHVDRSVEDVGGKIDTLTLGSTSSVSGSLQG